MIYTNVFHKRVATPSEWPPQYRQNDCAATVRNTTMNNRTVCNSIVLFRLFAIFCILYFYFTGAGVMPSLTASAAAPT
jgi:hypothetical protein